MGLNVQLFHWKGSRNMFPIFSHIHLKFRTMYNRNLNNNHFHHKEILSLIQKDKITFYYNIYLSI
jgi:hypothetical protein